MFSNTAKGIYQYLALRLNREQRVDLSTHLGNSRVRRSDIKVQLIRRLAMYRLGISRNLTNHRQP